MGVTAQLWKPRQTPGCLLPIPRKTQDGSKPNFSWWNINSEKSSFQGCFVGLMKEASSWRDQRREHLAGSCTNSGNLDASDYQRWFTSVHFAPSIGKDLCIYLHWLTVSQHELKVSLLLTIWEGLDMQNSNSSQEKITRDFGESRQIKKSDKKTQLSPPLLKRQCETPENKMLMFWDSCQEVKRIFLSLDRNIIFCFDFYHHKLEFCLERVRLTRNILCITYYRKH